jgi:hypothetical protein
MNARFSLNCARVVAMILLTGGIAGAQIVTITTANSVAGPPPKADPQGTWSFPAGGGNYKVVFEYGTVNAGTFTLDLTIGAGGTVNLPVKAGGANGTWGPIGQETLQKNPLPKNTNVRAQLQKEIDNKWVVQATAYFPVN